jgi:hypothetical protein
MKTKRELEDKYLSNRDAIIESFGDAFTVNYKGFSMHVLKALKKKLYACLEEVNKENSNYIKELVILEEKHPTSQDEKDRFRKELIYGTSEVQRRLYSVVYCIIDKEDARGKS